MSKRSLYDSNPFSTRFVRPGAIEYLFPDGWSVERVLDSLANHGWRGAIVGPHGSGKSTLLATLLPAMAERGIQHHLVSLHDGQKWMPRGWGNVGRAIADQVLVIIDGYEQLSRISRWFVEYQCRRRGWGLLVTAHQRIPLPIIFETRPSLADFQTIVDRLLSPHVAILTPRETVAAYGNANGNLREALFELYDRYREATNFANQRLPSSVETA